MSAHLSSPNSESAILGRLIQGHRDSLSRGAAEYLLTIRFDNRDIARMNHLAELARDGMLNDEDGAELDSYVRVGDLLALMQSKARRTLRGLAQDGSVD